MIIIAGKNNIAVAALNHLVYELELPKKELAVVCNKTETGSDNWQMSLRKHALRLGVSEITLKQAEEKAEFFFSLEFDQIVNPNNFKTSNLFNIHFSLLPKYKGMYTSIWPILNGDSEAGCSLHEIDAGIDTGAIIEQSKFALSERDSAVDLYLKYISASIFLFKKNASTLLSGNWQSVRQSSLGSTYFSKKALDFKNIKIDMQNTAWRIGRQIKAFAFRPYQLPIIHGKKIVNYKISQISSYSRPGKLLKETEQYFEFATVDYNVYLYKDKQKEIFDAIKADDFSTFEKYLLNIPSIEDRTRQTWSMLMVAAYNGKKRIVEKLIEQGADVNAANFKGTTVLMYAKDYALKSSDLSIYNLLMDNGADETAKDFLHKSIDDYVKGDSNWARLLVEHSSSKENRL
tara:strand:- start:1012 stop:2220 length:1209 start_codon:yes stop_codon:yes gene_type:complete